MATTKKNLLKDVDVDALYEKWSEPGGFGPDEQAAYDRLEPEQQAALKEEFEQRAYGDGS